MVQDRKRSLIEQSAFFANFSRRTIDGLLPLLRECRFNKSNVICLKGDPSDFLYLVCDGQVEISVSSKDGKTIVLGVMSAGAVFGEIGILDEGLRTANVTAATDVALYRLSRQDFLQASKDFTPSEWLSITVYVCNRFRRVTGAMEEKSFLDADMRVLRKILEIYEGSSREEKESTPFKLSLSQEALAKMVGLSREAINKTLSRLNKAGIIQKKYKHILIPDIFHLRHAASREESDSS